MTKLYEMTKDYLEFLDSDMPQDELKDCLDSIECAIEEKGANIVKLINSLDNETLKPIDDEIKRLQARKKAIANKKESLKEYLRINMEATGINRIQHPLFNITLGKPSKVAEIVDEDLLPDEYVTVKTELKPDKKKILSDLKQGVDIPGAGLVDGKSKLLMK